MVFFFNFLKSFCPGTGQDRGVCPGTFAPALVKGQRDTGTRFFFVPGQRDNGTSRGTSRPLEPIVEIGVSRRLKYRSNWISDKLMSGKFKNLNCPDPQDLDVLLHFRFAGSWTWQKHFFHLGIFRENVSLSKVV